MEETIKRVYSLASLRSQKFQRQRPRTILNLEESQTKKLPRYGAVQSLSQKSFFEILSETSSGGHDNEKTVLLSHGGEIDRWKIDDNISERKTSGASEIGYP